MATAPAAPQTDRLTYAQYRAEPEINARYDILEGARIFMPGPRPRHQRIQVHVTEALRAYETQSGSGYVFPAPCDVLIRSLPRLQVRQSDVLYISKTRLAQDGDLEALAFLAAAPELIVEILSDSDTERALAEKLADYAAIGVREGWLLRPAARTLEQMRLHPDGPASLNVYDEAQTVVSLAFPDLQVAVADLFKP